MLMVHSPLCNVNKCNQLRDVTTLREHCNGKGNVFCGIMQEIFMIGEGYMTCQTCSPVTMM